MASQDEGRDTDAAARAAMSATARTAESATARAGVGAVLVAAGSSRRFASAGNKVLAELAGEAVLVHGVRALAQVAAELVVVARATEHAAMGAALAAAGFDGVRLVEGGSERADSVRCGLAALSARTEVVLVHDAARPLVLASDAQRVVEAVRAHGAALLVEPMVDTVKRSSDGAFAEGTVERSELWRAQTPQGFEAPRLIELHARALEDGVSPTDDAALWERGGGRVALVEAHEANFKITRPLDLVLAEAVVRARTQDAN